MMATDRHVGDRISEWLQEAAPSRLPDRVLEATFERTRRSGQELGWRGRVGRLAMPRAVSALGGATIVVAAVVVGLAIYLAQQALRPPAGLPSHAESWGRGSIELPSGYTGRVVSLAAGPGGLLAVVAEDVPNENDFIVETRLAVSADGRTWSLVPEDRHPTLSTTRAFGNPVVAGTADGFLMLQLNEVWTSETGFDWLRLAGELTDPDLRGGGPTVVTVGGPGLVGLGGDGAWYSADGSDWARAEVPPLPEAIATRPEDSRVADFTGVTARASLLVGWGSASADNGALQAPLLWASSDGRTWVNVADPSMTSVTAVTGGPRGFAAAGRATDAGGGTVDAIWFSLDGRAWERVQILEGRPSPPGERSATALAATDAGYVLVRQDAIWTSPDGRAWARLPDSDLLRGAIFTQATTWGSRFLVGGAYGSMPAIWITDGNDPQRTAPR